MRKSEKRPRHGRVRQTETKDRADPATSDIAFVVEAPKLVAHAPTHAREVGAALAVETPRARAHPPADTWEGVADAIDRFGAPTRAQLMATIARWERGEIAPPPRELAPWLRRHFERCHGLRVEARLPLAVRRAFAVAERYFALKDEQKVRGNRKNPSTTALRLLAGEEHRTVRAIRDQLRRARRHSDFSFRFPRREKPTQPK